jgi:hypothetical protein
MIAAQRNSTVSGCRHSLQLQQALELVLLRRREAVDPKRIYTRQMVALVVERTPSHTFEAPIRSAVHSNELLKALRLAVDLQHSLRAAQGVL